MSVVHQMSNLRLTIDDLRLIGDQDSLQDNLELTMRGETDG
jgi:hypothetical protein